MSLSFVPVHLICHWSSTIGFSYWMHPFGWKGYLVLVDQVKHLETRVLLTVQSFSWRMSR